jgi:hypothetical protein
MEYNETVQVNTKKTIQEHIDSGTLSDFIEKMIEVGHLFFRKVTYLENDFLEERYTELTLEEKKYIHFVVNMSDSYATDEIDLPYFLIKFDNYQTILKGLEKEFIKKFNDFHNDKMQKNYANILIYQVQNLHIFYESLVSIKEMVSFSNRKMSTSDLERETFYLFLVELIEDYKSILIVLVESYHPEKHITNEEQYIETTKNQFTWSESKTDLAELVYALTKTESIKSITTGKTATKEELLKYFSEQFAQDITDQSLLTNSKRTYKKTKDLNTFTRKLADIVDTYLKK